MDLTERAKQVVDQASVGAGISMDESQQSELQKIVEQAIIFAILESSVKSRNAIIECCSADADMAHKLTRRVDREHDALIANLSGMR